MNRRDIVIGVLILAAIGAAVYFFRNPSQDPLDVAQTTPSAEQRLEESMNIDIPDDAEKVELEDKTDSDSSAVVTRETEDGFKVRVLADLPEPSTGSYYQGWIENEEGKFIKIGTLRQQKGGWLLDYSSTTDYSEYEKVIITEESVSDNTPEEVVLEGSF